MNVQSSLPQRAAAALLGIAVAVWGAWNLVDSIAYERWSRKTWEANAPLEPGRNQTAAFLRTAHLAQDAVLPPNYATAETMLTEAIRRDPLRSDLWLDLARVQAYQGKREIAATSLLRSDELDPRFPFQRMESIKLWMLLGDVDRAVELAQHVGMMDFELRIEMAKTLRALGKTPAQIFQLLEGGSLTNGEMTRFLGALRSESPERMRELFEQIPATMYQDLENRRAIAELAMRPLVPEVALQIWQLENQTLSVVPTSSESKPPFLVDNLQLKRPLPKEQFVFGWQPLTYTEWAGMNWHPPDEIGADHGALSLVVDHLSQPARDTLRYTFYRFVLPADMALKTSVRLKAEPAGRSRCHFRVQPLGGNAVESSPADSLKAGWQVLEVDLPAAAEARTVELIMVRAPRGNSISESPTRLYLGELSLVPTVSPIIEVSDGGTAR